MTGPHKGRTVRQEWIVITSVATLVVTGVLAVAGCGTPATPVAPRIDEVDGVLILPTCTDARVCTEITTWSDSKPHHVSVGVSAVELQALRALSTTVPLDAYTIEVSQSWILSGQDGAEVRLRTATATENYVTGPAAVRYGLVGGEVRSEPLQ